MSLVVLHALGVRTRHLRSKELRIYCVNIAVKSSLRSAALLAMKGENAHPRTRSSRNTNNRLSPEALVMHVKKEEDVSSGSPGPVSRSPKQPVKSEAKPDAAAKPRKRQKVKQEDPVAQQMVKLASVSPTAYTGPFPKHLQPTPEACRVALLSSAHLVLPQYHAFAHQASLKKHIKHHHVFDRHA